MALEFIKNNATVDELFKMGKLLYENHPNRNYRRKFAELEAGYKMLELTSDRLIGIRMTVEYKKKSSKNSAKARQQGNSLFQQKRHDVKLHHEILYKYSQSVAVAPAESEELGLALNTRSIFLMHLKKYSNCVSDIDYALSVTKSEVLKSKLLYRKVQCLLAMNHKNEAKYVFNEAYTSLEDIKKEDEKIKNILLEELKKTEKNLFEDDCKTCEVELKKESLELENINDLPYISESVSFAYNKKFGKHMLANRDIVAGEILVVEKPFCLYPDLRELYYVCSHCLKFCFNNIPCNSCVFAVYCSKECQELAFEEYHDIECSINSELYKDPIDTLNIFMSRFYIKLIKSIGIKKIIETAELLDNIGNVKSENFNEDTINKIKNFNAFQFYYDFLTMDVISRNDFTDDLPAFFLGLLEKNNYFSDELSKKNVTILEGIFTKLLYNLHKRFLGVNRQHYAVKISNYILETKSNPNGVALAQSWNLINHNCYPNANKFLMKGGKLVVFASRPIKKNEQVYVTYGAKINRSKEERNEFLKKFEFKCNCLVCKNNWPKIDAEVSCNITKKISSNKKENPILANLIDEFECNSKEEFDEWKHDENKITKICEKLDKTYSKNPTYEDVAIIDEVRYFLTELFCVVYNEDFEMPDDY